MIAELKRLLATTAKHGLIELGWSDVKDLLAERDELSAALKHIAGIGGAAGDMDIINRRGKKNGEIICGARTMARAVLAKVEVK